MSFFIAIWHKIKLCWFNIYDQGVNFLNVAHSYFLNKGLNMYFKKAKTKINKYTFIFTYSSTYWQKLKYNWAFLGILWNFEIFLWNFNKTQKIVINLAFYLLDFIIIKRTGGYINFLKNEFIFRSEIL